MVTNIYVESSSRYIREKDRVIGYVVDYTDESGNQLKNERGEPVVRWGWGKRTGTYTGSLLIALAFAMSHADITEKVRIHTCNKFVIGMLDTYLPGWIDRDFVRKDREEIRYLNLWKYIGGILKDRRYDTAYGKHTYYDWMMEEMEKVEEERREDVCKAEQDRDTDEKGI